MASKIAAMFAASRHAALVGRARERDELRRFLQDPEQVLLYLHGPGGVGKTTLLQFTADTAAQSGRSTVWVDCAVTGPNAERFTDAVRARVDESDSGPDLADPVLLVIDRFEVAGPLVGWLWRSFIPTLPDGSQVVVAGRDRTPHDWAADPAFRRHAHVLPVRNLAPDDAASLARACGIDTSGDVADVVTATYGHPLAIVIASEFATGATGASSDSGRGVLWNHPDVAARFLGRFLDDDATALQRAALHVCGHARRVDRAMLREVLHVDNVAADELLAWLRARPYTESWPDGLRLHDVVRDALDRDLRWRDRAEFERLHADIRATVVARMRSATSDLERDHATMDLLYLSRGDPAARQVYSLDQAGAASRTMRVDDVDDREWVVRAFEGDAAADRVRYWVDQQPEAVTVFEDALGRRTGAMIVARVDRAGRDVGSHDPVTGWALAQLAQRRPPEPGEVVLHNMAIDAEVPGRLGRVADQTSEVTTRSWRVPRLGWNLFSTSLEDSWAPKWTFMGFEQLGHVESNGVPVAVWARDFGRSGYDEWFDWIGTRELTGGAASPPSVTTSVALSRADFEDAVRQLFKDLGDPVRVRSNPLTESHLVPVGDDAVEVLSGRVRQALDRLAGMPRMDIATRAIERTYLRPAASHEKAAEVVGVPFSTYRRHLAKGLDQVVELLWDWELHGPPVSPDPT